MFELIGFGEGGYSFLRGGFPYSQGVVAQRGFAIERARFLSPIPMMDGFRMIADHLQSLGRPLTAVCAAELRSPRPLSFTDFGEFNKGYVAVLREWGVVKNGTNPVARSNVAPVRLPPSEPSFYAFAYTVPARGEQNFVVAGSGEWPEGGRYPDDVICLGDTSPEGIRTKARWVLDMMEARMRGLGAEWKKVSATQVYTEYDIHPFLDDEIIRRGAGSGGITWHYCRPPIAGMDYEMDVRGVKCERVVGY